MLHEQVPRISTFPDVSLDFRPRTKSLRKGWHRGHLTDIRVGKSRKNRVEGECWKVNKLWNSGTLSFGSAGDGSNWHQPVTVDLLSHEGVRARAEWRPGPKPLAVNSRDAVNACPHLVQNAMAYDTYFDTEHCLAFS